MTTLCLIRFHMMQAHFFIKIFSCFACNKSFHSSCIINILNDQKKVFISSLQYLCALRSAYLQQSPFIYIVKVVIFLGGNEGWQTFQQTTHPAASNMPLFNSGIFIFSSFIFLIDIFEHCFNFCPLNCQASGKGAT